LKIAPVNWLLSKHLFFFIYLIFIWKWI